MTYYSLRNSINIGYSLLTDVALRVHSSNYYNFFVVQFCTVLIDAFRLFAGISSFPIFGVLMPISIVNMTRIVTARVIAGMQRTIDGISAMRKFECKAIKSDFLAIDPDLRVAATAKVASPYQAFIRMMGFDGRNYKTVEFFPGKLIGHRGSSKAAVDLSRHAMQLAGGFFILQQNHT